MSVSPAANTSLGIQNPFASLAISAPGNDPQAQERTNKEREETEAKNLVDAALRGQITDTDPMAGKLWNRLSNTIRTWLGAVLQEEKDDNAFPQSAANLIDQNDSTSSSLPGGFAAATAVAKRFWAKRARWLKNPEALRQAINARKEKQEEAKKQRSALKEDNKASERTRIPDMFTVQMEEQKKRTIVLEAQRAFTRMAQRAKAFIEPAPEPETLRFVPAIAGMASGLIAGVVKPKTEPTIMAPKDLELKPSLNAVNDDDTLVNTI